MISTRSVSLPLGRTYSSSTTSRRLDFAQLMNRSFPDAYFALVTRANFLTSKTVETLKNANCYSLNFGFESGSDRILQILMKRMDRMTNISAYQKILSTPITPALSFMVGTHGETEDTIRDTISAIKEARVESGGIFYTTPYPGSKAVPVVHREGVYKK